MIVSKNFGAWSKQTKNKKWWNFKFSIFDICQLMGWYNKTPKGSESAGVDGVFSLGSLFFNPCKAE